MDVITKKETTFLRDIPEIGEVDLDEVTEEPIMNTYVKKKEEDLVITDWYEQIGVKIFTPAKEMIARIAGYTAD